MSTSITLISVWDQSQEECSFVVAFSLILGYLVAFAVRCESSIVKLLFFTPISYRNLSRWNAIQLPHECGISIITVFCDENAAKLLRIIDDIFRYMEFNLKYPDIIYYIFSPLYILCTNLINNKINILSYDVISNILYQQ